MSDNFLPSSSVSDESYFESSVGIVMISETKMLPISICFALSFESFSFWYKLTFIGQFGGHWRIWSKLIWPRAILLNPDTALALYFFLFCNEIYKLFDRFFVKCWYSNATFTGLSNPSGPFPRSVSGFEPDFETGTSSTRA